MHKLLIIASFILFVFSVSAQNNEDIIKKQLQERGEVYISISEITANKNKESLRFFDYDKSENNRLYFYANKKAINSIKTKSIDIRLEAIPSLMNTVAMLDNAKLFTSNWDAYPTYEQYDSIMHKFATDYPQICKYHNLGSLQSGRKIMAIQLGDSIDFDINEPQFFYTSTMHGDETVGYIMSLRLIEYLLQNYNSNARVKYLMDNVDIWINPLANPDGTYYTGNSSVNGAKRYNMNNVDINRNFPDPEDGPHPDGNTYQAETQIFMNFADSMHFTMSANMHSGAEVVNYPWDTWSQLPADDDWWVRVSKTFADSAQYNSPNGYMTMFGTGYTNGYQWYSVWGSRQDYMNYFKHCREVTLELSNTKLLPESQLQDHWNYLRPSLLNYLQEVTYGIRGKITDSITGQPLHAKVEILNHDIDSSLIYSSDSGYYFRPIFTGNYDVKYSAKGYKSKIFSISAINNSAIIKDVQLATGPDAINANDNYISISLFPNPVINILNIKSDLAISSYKIYNVLGSLIIYENVNNSSYVDINVSVCKPGVYIIQIETLNGSITHKFLKN